MQNAKTLRHKVHQAYSAIAEQPQNEPPFATGRTLAEGVGYSAELLETLPRLSVEAFCGVSNVSVFADLKEGDSVLEIGCGAGLDTLIAAKRVGEAGKVTAIDFSKSMLKRAQAAALETSLTNIEFYHADAEMLPLEDSSVDKAIANGIFNLNPFREAIFSELSRVIRPGGDVYAAELILSTPLSQQEREQTINWLSWIAGAKESGAFLEEFRAVGFDSVTLLRAVRNLRVTTPKVLVAEVMAQKF